ncbi:hypothetical protein [Chitinophaga silvisoli]|nr:hypothetical protein [Chitinophaga silvisoli]
MDVSEGFDSLTNQWTNNLTTLADFQESISYDENGNILKYKRNGNNTFAGSPLDMDSLNYHYRPGTNKLDYVHDAVNASSYSNDVDDQIAGNYRYDSIGNIISDIQAGIDR